MNAATVLHLCVLLVIPAIVLSWGLLALFGTEMEDTDQGWGGDR